MDGSIDTGRQENDGLVVFSILRQSTCSECGVDIGGGEFLKVEQPPVGVIVSRRG